jgi:hypothetical protein
MLAPAAQAGVFGAKKSATIPNLLHSWSASGWGTSGSDVLTLNDSIGGATATAVAGTKPQMATLNGLPAWDYNGNSYLKSAAVADVLNQFSILVVGDLPSTNQLQVGLQTSGSASLASIYSFLAAVGNWTLQINDSSPTDTGPSGSLTSVGGVALVTADLRPASGSRKARVWWSRVSMTAAAASRNDIAGVGSGTVVEVQLGCVNNNVSYRSLSTVNLIQVGGSFVDDANAPAILASYAAAWNVTPGV